ncbi:hypothetical protein B0A48_05710 [Cryoendolithus antarcticus]|uniref:DUF7703 domain-containing protein n=1 Tax=Cryoendolithus antarcticus TaxID=1507870 RepID=A0A1V8TBS4_9PEZI|nr:hypothetical protein B0A48_05710 [Cryoendolithus antarcticus]
MASAPDDAGSASWLSPGAGIAGGYNGNSETLRMFIVFFSGLAIYNACELVAMIAITFKRYHGLYFWSLLITSIGIIPYSLGFLLKFMNITTGNARWLAVVLLTIGWYPMITGQSLVLWSRLHLLVTGKTGDRILRYTKIMIITNAIILHIPTTVLTFGSNGSIHTAVFERGYNVMEKLQMAGFFVQEVILSSIYIAEIRKILRASLHQQTRKTMMQLIAINVIIIIMDLSLLGLECASLYILETLLKGIIYSIKLKLEFAVLNKLVRHVTSSKPIGDVRQSSIGFSTTVDGADGLNSTMDVSEFVDQRKCGEAVEHAAQAEHDREKHQPRRNDSRLAYDLARFEHVENIARLDDISRTTSCHKSIA